MSTFLAKTEPSEYSIDDLLADDITAWSGPRGVEVPMSVEPHDSPVGASLCEASRSTDGRALVAAEGQREAAVFDGVPDLLRD